MVCQFLLYNKVNQLYICIHPHISSLLCLPPILPIPPLQVDTKHGADLPVLCGCFPLVIYFTFGSVYMSMTLSHFVPAYPSPFPCPQVHSLCLRLYSCPAPRFFRTIFFFFRFHIYVLAYGICFSLSDLLHRVLSFIFIFLMTTLGLYCLALFVVICFISFLAYFYSLIFHTSFSLLA